MIPPVSPPRLRDGLKHGYACIHLPDHLLDCRVHLLVHRLSLNKLPLALLRGLV